MNVPEMNDAVAPVMRAFQELGVEYYFGGSIASSTLGISRATNDADLVADFRLTHVTPFVQRLAIDFYVSEPAIRSAIERRSCFNVIHLKSAFKVDVFVLKNRPFDEIAMSRRQFQSLYLGETEVQGPVASAEDIVLAKLEWFRKGGEVSDRQWTDIKTVLQVQSSGIDLDYLWHWSREIHVDDLLLRVLADAGLPPPNQSVPF